MHGRVESIEWPTPSLARVVLNGDGLADYAPVPYSDSYVNVAIPPAGASYAAPFALDDLRVASARAAAVPAPHHRAPVGPRLAPPDARVRHPRRLRGRRPVGGRRPPGRRAGVHRPGRRLPPGPRRRLAPDGRRRVGAAGDRRVARGRARRRAGRRPARLRRPRETSSRSRPPGAWTSPGCTAAGGPGDADLLADAVAALAFPRGPGARVRARRSRRDPRPSAGTCSPTAASTPSSCPARPIGAAA